MNKQNKDWNYKESKILDDSVKKEFEETGGSMLELLIAQLIVELKRLNKEIYE